MPPQPQADDIIKRESGAQGIAETFLQRGGTGLIIGGSKSSGTMTANVAALQAWADAAGDWRDSRQGMRFPADLYFFNGTVTWPSRSGLPCVKSDGGETIWFTEAEYATGAVFGGSTPVMVWGDPATTDEVMHDIFGYGGVWEVQGQGKSHANNSTTLIQDADGNPYPYATPTELGGSHADEDRCLTFLRINSVEDLGSGKHIFPYGLHAHLFQIGVHVTHTDGFTNHGDQCIVYGRSTFFFTDIGILFEERQSVLWDLAHIDTLHCTYPIVLVNGGKIKVGKLDIQSDTKAGMLVIGNNEADSIYPSACVFGWVNFDQTAASDSQFLRIEPDSGNVKVNVNVTECFHVNPTRSAAIRGTPVYYETAGTIDVNGGAGGNARFTANDNNDLSGITVGDWVEFGVDNVTPAAWVPTGVSRVTAVNDASNHFDFEDSPVHSGALGSDLTGDATVKVWGVANEKPVITCIDGYGTIRLNNHEGLTARSIHVSGGTSSFYPTFILSAGEIAVGGLDPAHLEDLFTTTSSGYFQLILVGTFEESRFPNPWNNGEVFDGGPLRGSLSNGEYTPL